MTLTHTDPNAAPAEYVVLRVRSHPRRLLPSALLLVALSGLVGYFGTGLPELWMSTALWVGAALLGVLLCVGPVLSWLTQRTVVTSRRIILRRGVFVQHRTELSLSRIREVRSRRTVLQRMFGSGNIHLLSGTGSPIVLRDVPGSELISDALHELIERNYAESVVHTGQVMPHAFTGASEQPFFAPGPTNGFAPERTPPQPSFGAVLAGSAGADGNTDSSFGDSSDDTVRISPTSGTGEAQNGHRTGFAGGRFTRAQR